MSELLKDTDKAGLSIDRAIEILALAKEAGDTHIVPEWEPAGYDAVLVIKTVKKEA